MRIAAELASSKVALLLPAVFEKLVCVCVHLRVNVESFTRLTCLRRVCVALVSGASMQGLQRDRLLLCSGPQPLADRVPHNSGAAARNGE